MGHYLKKVLKKQKGIVTNLILDGKIMEEDLKELGLDKIWLD